MRLYLAVRLFTFTLIGHLARCVRQLFTPLGQRGYGTLPAAPKPHKLQAKVIISTIKAKNCFPFMSIKSPFPVGENYPSLLITAYRGTILF